MWPSGTPPGPQCVATEPGSRPQKTSTGSRIRSSAVPARTLSDLDTSTPFIYPGEVTIPPPGRYYGWFDSVMWTWPVVATAGCWSHVPDVTCRTSSYVGGIFTGVSVAPQTVTAGAFSG